jgi:YHS domain-containing protein
MKKMPLLLIAAMVSLLGASVLIAADKPTAPPTTAPTTKPAAKLPAINKFCAVEGGDHTVDPDFFTMYKGMKIGFCCADCIKSFEEDPESYIAKMKARKDGVK